MNCFERTAGAGIKELSRSMKNLRLGRRKELNKQESVSEGVPEGESVRRMMIQPEEMTRYCEVMEENRRIWRISFAHEDNWRRTVAHVCEIRSEPV